MLRQKLSLVIVVVTMLSLPVGCALAKMTVVRTCLTRGHTIVRPLCPGVSICPMAGKHVVVAPPRRRLVITSGLLGKFVHIRPHRHHVVQVRHPRVRHVVVRPGPTVVVGSRIRVAEPTRVTVWVTNSNGSRTAVKLTRSGLGFIGPRGEWYPSLPTNQQLRIAYGF